MTDDEKSPVERAVSQAVDLFVHAPIGLVFDGPALLPQLIERGRNQVATARMIGQFAVQQGSQEVTKVVGQVQDQVTGIIQLFGGGDRPSPAARSAASPPPEATAPAPPPTGARPAAGPSGDGVADAGHLAIPDYDALSASQVVNRLAGLSPSELEAVRAYEASARGRKTILNKIAQLQSP